MTHTQIVACNNCGAPLNADSNSRYLSCSYCGARLMVKRTSSNSYTEVLEQFERIAVSSERASTNTTRIATYTEHTAGNTDVLRLKAQLDVIDAEWPKRRESLRLQVEQEASAGPLCVFVFGVGISVGIILLMVCCRSPDSAVVDVGIGGKLMLTAMTVTLLAWGFSILKAGYERRAAAQQMLDAATQAYEARRLLITKAIAGAKL